ncbi:hypothetical protein BDQ17DRAFT_1435875 [Cyathus striatus]|nr:hypothetical protein BDQ17DRAFT_1435875 [Cyathus striatus]
MSIEHSSVYRWILSTLDITWELRGLGLSTNGTTLWTELLYWTTLGTTIEKHPSDDIFSSTSSGTSGTTCGSSTQGQPIAFNTYRKSLESLDFGHIGGYPYRLSQHGGHLYADSTGGGSDGDAGSSVPSSAASSSVHLPLGGEVERPSSSYSNPAQQQQQSHPAAQDFHNAFGAMSLDDPGVLAGLTTDAAPFFSDPFAGSTGDPEATPMPPSGATSKEDKEGERAMWKEFLRTPLSGPNTSNSIQQQQQAQQQRGARQRVASLPSVKTPGPGFDTSRTAHEDDLRSYEAAVMARKAPVQLTLQPRLRRPPGQQQRGAQQQVPIARFSQGGSMSSSLAGVFGRPAAQAQAQAQLVPATFPRGGRMGNVAVKEEDGLRPTFKRLPSQTLGPPNSKRAFRGPAEEDDERGWAYNDEKEEEDRKPPRRLRMGRRLVLFLGALPNGGGG